MTSMGRSLVTEVLEALCQNKRSESEVSVHTQEPTAIALCTGS